MVTNQAHLQYQSTSDPSLSIDETDLRYKSNQTDFEIEVTDETSLRVLNTENNSNMPNAGGRRFCLKIHENKCHLCTSNFLNHHIHTTKLELIGYNKLCKYVQNSERLAIMASILDVGMIPVTWDMVRVLEAGVMYTLEQLVKKAYPYLRPSTYLNPPLQPQAYIPRSFPISYAHNPDSFQSCWYHKNLRRKQAFNLVKAKLMASEAALEKARKFSYLLCQFSCQMTKKLYSLGQMTEDETKTALNLGIRTDSNQNWWVNVDDQLKQRPATIGTSTENDSSGTSGLLGSSESSQAGNSQSMVVMQAAVAHPFSDNSMTLDEVQKMAFVSLGFQHVGPAKMHIIERTPSTEALCDSLLGKHYKITDSPIGIGTKLHCTSSDELARFAESSSEEAFGWAADPVDSETGLQWEGACGPLTSHKPARQNFTLSSSSQESCWSAPVHGPRTASRLLWEEACGILTEYETNLKPEEVTFSDDDDIEYFNYRIQKLEQQNDDLHDQLKEAMTCACEITTMASHVAQRIREFSMVVPSVPSLAGDIGRRSVRAHPTTETSYRALVQTTDVGRPRASIQPAPAPEHANEELSSEIAECSTSTRPTTPWTPLKKLSDRYLKAAQGSTSLAVRKQPSVTLIPRLVTYSQLRKQAEESGGSAQN